MSTNTEPNGWISSAFLMGIWSIIIFSIFLSITIQNVGLYLFSVFIIGSCQRYLDEISHHAIHRNLFSHAGLNNRLDIFYAIPLFYTIHGTREEHYIHHTHLKDQQSTNNYAYDYLSINGNLLNYAWYRRFILYVQPFLGIQALIEFKNIIVNFKANFWNCYLYHLIVIATLAHYHLAYIYIYYWIIPYFTVYCIFYYYAELFTHFGCREKYLSRDTNNWFINFFLAPLGFCKYHSLHHISPKTPWFKYHSMGDNYEKNRQSLRETFKSMMRLSSN